MEWQSALATALIGLVVYILGAFFTAGIKLWPRWRDDQGRIRNNPLHTIEAIFWPIAWPIWAGAYYYFWIFLGIWIVFRGIMRIPLALLRIPGQTHSFGEWLGNPPPD